MKIVLYFLGIFLIFSAFSIYQTDNDTYMLQQEQIKHLADDCSAAAMLYEDKLFFGQGYKVFNQTAGNDAIAYLMANNIEETPDEYFVYYFDGNGRVTVYKGKQLIRKEEGIAYPYLFEEPLTGYRSLVSEPRVIVTIDMGMFDYRLLLLPDQKLIRTSGYEYLGRE